MKWFNKQNGIIKFIMCISLVFILLFIVRMFFIPEEDLEYKNAPLYKERTILIEKDTYYISVNYPKFRNKNINKSITNWIYSYIKNFKKESKTINVKTTLEIGYSVYYINDYANVYFNIDNSLKPKSINKSFLLNLNINSLTNITKIYSKELLKSKIDAVKNKYPSFVSNVILEGDINKFNYLITDDGFTVYFNNLKYEKEISYIPSLKVNTDETIIDKYNLDETKKMVALTFDDGPSKYSLEILECLKLNDSKATFFELGTNMNNHKDITKKLYDNGMEIGNHTYSHKYLSKISLNDITKEINSTSNLYNSITGDKMSLLRPPYGSINQNVKNNSPLPIILWDIDSMDWHYKNSDISAPIVLDYAKDGDIILMHDVYGSTVELAKIIIPELKARGYELVTVSELAKHKNKELKPGQVIREIK